MQIDACGIELQAREQQLERKTTEVVPCADCS
jgi:hypothetical protein